MRTWVVYLLVDPRAGAIRYVGQTRYPHDRLISHIAGTTRSTRMWIDGLLALGYRPEMRIVEHSLESSRSARAAEATWIRDMRARGCSLLNVLPTRHNPAPFRTLPHSA